MPTYAYRCTACHHAFEVVQKFSDSPISECPECGSPVRKVFHPVGIVFKGSGWYINDSRKSDTSATEPAKASADAPKAADTAKPAETATPSTPAPVKTAAD